MLQGLTMGVGERLTGWVAENSQPIVNSDAGLRYCLALPMLCDTRLVGVLTLCSGETFGDEQARMPQRALRIVASR